MNVICKNYDYTVKEFDDRIVVSNSTYDAKYGLILLLSVLEFFSPDSDIYCVPVTIIIPKSDSNNNTEIVIDEKLRVHGSEDYEVVINKSEYDKWKRSYLITNIMTIIVSLLILVFAMILVIPSDMNAIVAAVILAFFVYLPTALTVRLCRQFKRAACIRIADEQEER